MLSTRSCPVNRSDPAAHRRTSPPNSATAFLASLLALGGAGAVWAIHLGFATMLGFNVTLLLGCRLGGLRLGAGVVIQFAW